MKNKKIITITVFVISVFIITASLVLLRIRSNNDKPLQVPKVTQETPQVTADDLAVVEVPAEVSQTSKVLVFVINTKDLGAMSVGSIEEYNSHARPEVTNDGNIYTFTITEAGRDVYRTTFGVPVSITEDFADDGTISMVESAKAEQITFATPRFGNGSVVTIRNKAGKVLLKDTIRNVKVNNNKPASYKTIVPKGDDVKAIEPRESR